MDFLIFVTLFFLSLSLLAMVYHLCRLAFETLWRLAFPHIGAPVLRYRLQHELRALSRFGVRTVVRRRGTMFELPIPHPGEPECPHLFVIECTHIERLEDHVYCAECQRSVMSSGVGFVFHVSAAESPKAVRDFFELFVSTLPKNVTAYLECLRIPLPVASAYRGLIPAAEPLVRVQPIQSDEEQRFLLEDPATTSQSGQNGR